MASRSHSPENDIFSSSLSLVPEREAKTAGTTSTDFGGLLKRPLLLHEDLKDGCGGQLWPAGMTLARYMLTYHHDLRGKTILEIGAGGGLVGLAVANGCLVGNGPKLVVTDQLPMFALMQKNVALNELEAEVDAQIYDWGSPMPAAVASQMQRGLDSDASPHPDLVLAADCVYFEPAFPLLLQTLKDLIGPNTTCYFCFKKRRKADMRFIKDMLKTFDVDEIEYEGREQANREAIFLYKVVKRTRAQADLIL